MVLTEKCYKCDLVFPTYSELAEHARAKHSQENLYTCQLCFINFTDICDLNTHKRNEHSGQLYENFCAVCRINFRSLSELTMHLASHHAQDQTSTKDLPDTSHDVESNQEKLNLFSTMDSAAESLHVCNLCNNLFSSSNHLEDHMGSQHGVTVTNKCTLCENFFFSKRDLVKHIECDHSVEHPAFSIEDFPCPHCGSTFKLFLDVKKHIESCHELELFFPCAKCEVFFSFSEMHENHGMSKHKPVL